MPLAPPAPPADFTALVQWHADEVEFLYASIGETTAYTDFAAHLEAQVARGAASALLPRDPELWAAVAAELRRRDAGVITPANAARFDALEG